MSTNRIYWLDWVRAIAISLVVLGHFYDLGGSVHFSSYLYGFHMPLFFLLSGITYKQKDIWNTIKPLFYPFLFFQAIYIVWYVFWGIIHDKTIYQAIATEIYKLVDGFMSGGLMPAEMLWFVVVLIWNRLILHFLIEHKFSNISIIILGIIAIVYVKLMPFNLLFTKTVVLSFPFYIAGYWLKKYIDKTINKTYAFAGVAMMILLYFSTQINGMIYMNMPKYGYNMMLFFINGFIGSVGTILICQALSMKSILIEHISKATLFVLCFHFWLVRYIRNLLEQSNITYSLYIAYSILITIILVSIGTYIYKATYKYLKVFYGKG